MRIKITIIPEVHETPEALQVRQVLSEQVAYEADTNLFLEGKFVESVAPLSRNIFPTEHILISGFAHIFMLLKNIRGLVVPLNILYPDNPVNPARSILEMYYDLNNVIMHEQQNIQNNLNELLNEVKYYFGPIGAILNNSFGYRNADHPSPKKIKHVFLQQPFINALRFFSASTSIEGMAIILRQHQNEIKNFLKTFALFLAKYIINSTAKIVPSDHQSLLSDFIDEAFLAAVTESRAQFERRTDPAIVYLRDEFFTTRILNACQNYKMKNIWIVVGVDHSESLQEILIKRFNQVKLTPVINIVPGLEFVAQKFAQPARAKVVEMRMQSLTLLGEKVRWYKAIAPYKKRSLDGSLLPRNLKEIVEEITRLNADFRLLNKVIHAVIHLAEKMGAHHPILNCALEVKRTFQL